MSRRTVKTLGIYDEQPIDIELSARGNIEFIVVCKSGNVFLFDWKTEQYRSVGQLDFPSNDDSETFTYLNQFRNKRWPLSIISHGNYVCIAQTFGQKGSVLNLEDSRYELSLYRGDYNVEHCSFPLAMFSQDEDTFLIHGTDWNRLDITNLESRKSVTERVVDYETNSNYFDYFHSSLSISPDSRRFTSNGWFWGPCDVITVYEIENFLSNFELGNIQLDFGPVDGYNWDRPMCWINDRTIGVAYNSQESEEKPRKVASEILFIDTAANQVTGRIKFDGFAISSDGAPIGDLYFDNERNWFVSLNSFRGLLITDTAGNEVRSDPFLLSHKYSVAKRRAYSLSLDRFEIELVEL